MPCPTSCWSPCITRYAFPWEWAVTRVTELNAALVQFSNIEPALKLLALEWDVYLTSVNEVRADLRTATNVDAKARFAAVTLPMPRFIWRATAFRDDAPLMDVLFDATDIDTGDGLIQVVFHDPLTRDFLKNFVQATNIDTLPLKDSVKICPALDTEERVVAAQPGLTHE